MLALAHVMKDSPPDLILSGVNRGANLAEDVTYSGTVSAAMEGALAGVRSIALSQAYSREGMGDTVPFAAAEAWARARSSPPLLDAAVRAAHAGQRQFPRARARRGQGRARLPPGLPRLWPAADRRAHRPARLSLFLVRAGPDRADARAMSPTSKRSPTAIVSVTPLHLDLTHDRGAGPSSASSWPLSAGKFRADYRRMATASARIAARWRHSLTRLRR